MSLLGRLEDLSLPDIIQIVFLSRRTGILEILDLRGRHTILFHHGLIVNASSPEDEDLASHVAGQHLIEGEEMDRVEAALEEGTVLGDFLLEQEILSPAQLAGIIQKRIVDLVSPLLASKEGDFNFLLSEDLDRIDIGYDPTSVFREGGIPPQKILGGEGEKVKPLQGLEESMRAGKALLRGATGPAAPPLDLGLPNGGEEPDLVEPAEETAPFGEVEEEGFALEPASPAEAPAESEKQAKVVRFPTREESPFDIDLPQPEVEPLEALLEERADRKEPERLSPSSEEPSPAAPIEQPRSGEFRIGTDGPGTQAPDEDRNVVLLERDPLVRVAARRAFGRRGIRTYQFGSPEDARSAIRDLLQRNRFFVTFLELSNGASGDAAIPLLQLIKKRNRHLPVVMVDREADLRRRHHLLELGADLYLTKPAAGHLQPGLVDQSLALFADELVLFADHALFDWEQLTGTLGEGEVGRKFYDIAEKEKLNRSLKMVRRLIDELSNPDDIGEVSQTILRLANEYLDRALLFVATHRQFIGLGGFGVTGEDEEMNERARGIRISREESSVLLDVTQRAEPHRGKIRRSQGNVKLIASLGSVQPTEILVLPIVQEGRVLGLLYGDNAENKAPLDQTGGLELFLGQAAFAFENAIIANARRRELDWE